MLHEAFETIFLEDIAMIIIASYVAVSEIATPRSELASTVLLHQALSKVGLGHLIRGPMHVNIASSRPSSENLPADSSARHRRDYPRSPPSHEPTPAILTLDDFRSTDQPSDVPDFLLLAHSSRLKQCLDHIQRRRDSSCECTSEPASYAVCDRIVLLLRVHDSRERVVCHELCRRERDSHAKSGRV